MERITIIAAGQKSTLTGFFDYCANNEWARAYTYQEFPSVAVWHHTESIWSRRQKGYAIGRMYFASPNSSEKFYLRLLLTNVRGPQSYDYLCTVNNVVHPTFKSACVALGLLEDDE